MTMFSSEFILGIKTDVYYVPAANPKGRKTLVFLIAGNPGTIEFYVAFLKELSEQLNSVDVESNEHYDIYCPGHALHHLDDGSGCNYQSKGLEFQIEHKIAFITHILKSTRFDGEIILVGHSIGSFMVLDIISKNVLIKKHTKHVSLLMPFIFWDNIPYSHRMKLNTFVLNYPAQLALTGVIQCMRFTIFDVVPRSLLKWIVKCCLFTTRQCDSEYDYIADILCNRLFTYRLVNNFLHMGSDEIRQVPLQQKRMLTILQKIDCDNKRIYHNNAHNVNLHFVYTDNDEWAPCEDIKLLENTLAVNKSVTDVHRVMQPRIAYIEDLGHTFTMKKDATTKVVEELVLAITGVKTHATATSDRESRELRTTASNGIGCTSLCMIACSLVGYVGIGFGVRLLMKRM